MSVFKVRESITTRRSQQEKSTEAMDDFLATVGNLLDEYGCDQLIGVDVVEAASPFFKPVLPFTFEEESDCKRNMIYKYVRKTQGTEKTRLQIISLKDQKAIGGLYVYGTLIDYILFRVIVDIAKLTFTLKVLRLVDCSLKDEGIYLLGKELGKTRITHLYLDRNPVETQNYYCILENNLSLQHLSLVQCHINVKGARELGQKLGPPKGDYPTHVLKSLNLNNNHLDNYAVKFIAQGLRWNRDLVYLLLAGNRIGNAGLEFISNAMQLGILEKWEKQLNEKRLLERTEYITTMLKHEFDDYKNDTPKEMDVESHVTGNDVKELETLIMQYIKNDPNPIGSDVLRIGNKLISPGNRTLKMLDISYNKIEEEGFKHLLNVLRNQIKERKELNEIDREKYHLTTLELSGNFCRNDSKVLHKINYYLREMEVVEIKGWEDFEVEEEEIVEKDEIPEEEPHEVVEVIDKSRTSIIVDKSAKKTRKRKSVKESFLDEDESFPPIDFDDLLEVPDMDEESSDIESLISLILEQEDTHSRSIASQSSNDQNIE